MDSSSPHPRRLRPILKKRKKVSFSPFAVRVFVDKLSSSNHLWYSDEDYDSFKRQKIAMVVALKSIGMTKLDASQDTSIWLGLEQNLFYPQETSQRRNEVKVAVRLEQLRQVRLGIYDPDSMAKISEAQTLLCSKRAQLTGLIHSRNIGGNCLFDISTSRISRSDASANARAA